MLNFSAGGEGVFSLHIQKIYIILLVATYSSNKVEKPLCILPVCLPTCARSNSHKYSSRVLKFKYVIHIGNTMGHIQNGIYGTDGLSTDTHKSFQMHYNLWGGKHLKRILICFYCNKYNKTNICHSDTRKNVSYKKITQMLEVFCMQAHTKVFWSKWRKCLKCILAYLLCINYNEIKVCHINLCFYCHSYLENTLFSIQLLWIQNHY